MNYWLLKSEPDAYSIDDLANEPKKTEHWDGIRNYQARNFMRDEMKKGDLAFFYQSNSKEPGIVGIVEVVREAYPDHTALDKKAKYYDPKATKENPRWVMVDVKLKKRLKRLVSLAEMKEKLPLKDMRLVARGNRLSIMPVAKKEWDYILKLSEKPA